MTAWLMRRCCAQANAFGESDAAVATAVGEAAASASAAAEQEARRKELLRQERAADAVVLARDTGQL
jgi:hypothetical protein